MLIGREWIHDDRCIPSSLHQCLVFWNQRDEVEIMHADNRPFNAETNSAEYFMYEMNYGPTRVMNEGESPTIVAQNDEPYPAGLLNDLFAYTRPTTMVFWGPTNNNLNEEQAE